MTPEELLGACEAAQEHSREILLSLPDNGSSPYRMRLAGRAGPIGTILSGHSGRVNVAFNIEAVVRWLKRQRVLGTNSASE